MKNHHLTINLVFPTNNNWRFTENELLKNGIDLNKEETMNNIKKNEKIKEIKLINCTKINDEGFI